MSLMVGLIAVIVVVWGWDCWHRPYVDCRHCGGDKRDYDSDHEHFRLTLCLWCANSGLRLRWELRLLSVPF